jgi:hypothetical protein
MFVQTETMTMPQRTGLLGGRAPLEWRVAPAPHGELMFGEHLVSLVGEALKSFHHVPKLAGGALADLRAVDCYQRERRLADDPLGRAYAVRAVLCQALARLAMQDAEGAMLLEARFVRQKPIAHFEVEGYARATLLRRTRQVLQQLAWELWSLEGEAWEADRAAVEASANGEAG